MLQGMTNRLREIGRYYGMEKNVEKSKVMSTSQGTFSLEIVIDQKQVECVEYFKFVDSLIGNKARCTRDIKSSFATTKQLSTRMKLFSAANWILI